MQSLKVCQECNKTVWTMETSHGLITHVICKNCAFLDKWVDNKTENNIIDEL